MCGVAAGVAVCDAAEAVAVHVDVAVLDGAGVGVAADVDRHADDVVVARVVFAVAFAVVVGVRDVVVAAVVVVVVTVCAVVVVVVCCRCRGCHCCRDWCCCGG